MPPHDRDDLSQEVLLVVFREVTGFDRRRPGAFRAWLRVNLMNRARDYFRSRAGRDFGTGGSDSLERLNELVDPEGARSRLWDLEHDEHIAARAMARVRAEFAEKTWQALTRLVLEGRSAGEVAGELGMSRNAALVAKSRVLARVREEVAGLVG